MGAKGEFGSCGAIVINFPAGNTLMTHFEKVFLYGEIEKSVIFFFEKILQTTLVCFREGFWWFPMRMELLVSWLMRRLSLFYGCGI